MSNISSISAAALTSLSTASSQTSLSSLQSQLEFYSQYENGTGAAAEDYKALQFAIQTKNISDAQSALARLKRDSEASGSQSTATANATGSTNNSAGSSLTPSLIDVTA